MLLIDGILPTFRIDSKLDRIIYSFIQLKKKASRDQEVGLY